MVDFQQLTAHTHTHIKVFRAQFFVTKTHNQLSTPRAYYVAYTGKPVLWAHFHRKTFTTLLGQRDPSENFYNITLREGVGNLTSSKSNLALASLELIYYAYDANAL